MLGQTVISSERIREIGWDGVRRRMVQRLLAPLQLRREQGWQRRHPGRLPDGLLADLDLQALRRTLSERSWVFDSSVLGPRFRERHPRTAQVLLDQAEAALHGDLEWVAPGATSDWQRALPGVDRWSSGASHEIEIGGERPPGDVRLAWEVLRCSHIVRLAQASAISGESRFAKAAALELRRFAAEHPPGVGIAWIQGQEVALRGMAWLSVFRLLAREPVFDAALFELWLGQMLTHAEFLVATWTERIETHNHSISELVGLGVIGLALDPIAGSRRWARTAARLLPRELERQIHEDGMSAEGSTHYHAFVLDACIQWASFARLCGVDPDPRFASIVERMVDALAALLRSDGTLHAIGDSDAGRAIRWGVDPLDRRDLLAAAAVYFDRDDWRDLAGDPAASFWWMQGAGVPAANAAGRPVPAREFPDFGLALARAGGSRDEMILLRSGPGRARRGVLRSHTHADALSVLWDVEGEAVLLDPGTYLYSVGDGSREALRRTGRHNTVTLEGRDQADVTGARFGIEGLTRGRLVSFDVDDEGLSAEARHPEVEPELRRRIAWAPPGRLVLVDEATSPRAICTSFFQLSCTDPRVEPGRLSASLPSGRSVTLDVVTPAELSVHEGRPGTPWGWYAPRYGTWRAGVTLRVEQTVPGALVTVLQVGAAVSDTPSAIETAGILVVRLGEREWRFPRDGTS